MDIPKRSVPTPRARRIWEEIESLTLYDLLYLRDKMVEALGPGQDDGDAGGGVREPRRPIRPESGATTAAPLMYEVTGDRLESISSVWWMAGPQQ